jgi:hypothetical protein
MLSGSSVLPLAALATQRRLPGLLTAIALILPVPFDTAQAETTALPRPGSSIEWRQSVDIGRPAIVRQDIVAVAGAIVSYRETTLGGPGAPVQHETWRGLVLVKRHIPPSPAFTESTMSVTLDLPGLEKLLPLAPGRSIRIDVKGRTASRLGLQPTSPFLTGDLVGTLAITVERRETITVPAGTFATMVIRHEATLEQPGMDNRTTVAARIWFAPALGWPVKKHQLDAKGAVAGEAVALSIKRP